MRLHHLTWSAGGRIPGGDQYGAGCAVQPGLSAGPEAISRDLGDSSPIAIANVRVLMSHGRLSVVGGDRILHRQCAIMGRGEILSRANST